MDIDRKVIGIKESRTLDIKDNTEMAKWSKDIFLELSQKLDEHFQKEKVQTDENI